MHFRVWLQLVEALGSLNRWYCSEAHRRKIDDPNLLMEYYIKSGGAEDFAKRYSQATGEKNRWYCSEFYRREVREPEILWDYFMKYAPAGAVGKDPRKKPNSAEVELSIAC